MRIISVYNYYLNRGGEDEVFDSEAALLEAHGHEVLRYSKHNDVIASLSPVRLGAMTLWNRAAYDDLRRLVHQSQPDVVHFHNTFPLISPAAYYAVKREGVPVVQTLHNFRMVCPNALLFRDGGVCEECVGRRLPWPGVYHGCYQESRTATAGVAAMLTLHRMLMTWRKQVDVYVALTEFARDKFIAGGLPPEKIVVKPNFLFPDPGPSDGPDEEPYALFVGRLTENKGVSVLLEAWKELHSRIGLKIVGTGPLANAIESQAALIPGVVTTGRIPRDEVMSLMRKAYCVIAPYSTYEGMPMAILEAFAAGVPVIGSRLGGTAAMLKDGQTGLLFESGSAVDLVAKVRWLLDNVRDMRRMRQAARSEFDAHYTAEANYALLMKTYKLARAASELRLATAV